MKAVRIFLWIIICIIFLLGILYLFTGSLEWFPTPEQQEKARITAIIMMVIPIISCIILFLTRKKQGNQVFYQFFFGHERQKFLVLRNEEFFIQADRLGISSRRSRVYHRRRRISSHLQVCISVGLMIYKTKVLMICNSCGIDDIQCSALISYCFYAIRISRELHGLFLYIRIICSF